MAHPEPHLSVTVRGLCAAARPSHQGVCQCCCFFPRCRDRRKDSAEKGGHMYITHPEYACFESVPSKLVLLLLLLFLQVKLWVLDHFSILNLFMIC